MDQQLDSGDDLHHKVDEWVERSGRALELRTARAFRAAGATVVQMSRRYEGTTTEQHREMDVFAAFAWSAAPGVNAQLRVSVECKSGNDKPWVAFLDDWQFPPHELFEGSFVFKHGSYVGLTEPLEDLWKERPPFFPLHTMVHVATAELGSRQSGGGRNTAHDALRQAMSGAIALEAEYLSRQGPGSKKAHLVIAAVVTAAPLFTCHLDDDGCVVTESVEQLAVWEPRRDGRPTMVFVVSETALPKFASELAYCRDVAADAASANF